jgi:hypothetical protein
MFMGFAENAVAPNKEKEIAGDVSIANQGSNPSDPTTKIGYAIVIL